ncbi:MAG: hypothetical protein ACXVNM_05650 [Bacteroidia bacterium]
MFKFIGAALGYFLFKSFFGIMIGFVIGSVIDSFKIIVAKKDGAAGDEDVFNYYRQQASRSHEDFATMLMALSATVM